MGFDYIEQRFHSSSIVTVKIQLQWAASSFTTGEKKKKEKKEKESLGQDPVKLLAYLSCISFFLCISHLSGGKVAQHIFLQKQKTPRLELTHNIIYKLVIQLHFRLLSMKDTQNS